MNRLLFFYHQWHSFHWIIIIHVVSVRIKSKVALLDIIMLLLLLLMDAWLLSLILLLLQSAIWRWMRGIHWKSVRLLCNSLRPLLKMLLLLCWIFRIKSVIFMSRSSILWSCPMMRTQICVVLGCITTNGHKFLWCNSPVMDARRRRRRFLVNEGVCWYLIRISFAVCRCVDVVILGLSGLVFDVHHKTGV